MIGESQEVLERRAELIVRARMEREQILAALDRLEPYTRVADQAIHLGRTVAAHPEWILGAAAGLAIVRPRLLWRLSMRAWAIWRLVRPIRGFLRAVLPR